MAAAEAAVHVTGSSGPLQVCLLEVFTSEGCESCPPMESWLSEYKDDADLWRTFVPVALHVPYWDYLGWRDVLASPAFERRQRHYAAAWGASGLYTPCRVRNGDEYPTSKGARDFRVGLDRGAAPELSFDAQGTRDGTWSVRLTLAGDSRGLQLQAYAARLLCGLTSQVAAGENRGRKLIHDFSVAAVSEAAPVRRRSGPESAAGNAFAADLVVPEAPPDVQALYPNSQKLRQALAVWVEDTRSQKPVQASGAWWR